TRLGETKPHRPWGEVVSALSAIKKICRTGPRTSAISAVGIAEQVRQILRAAGNSRLRREGDLVISRAIDRFAPLDSSPTIVRSARLHAAVARFELALAQNGWLYERRRRPRP